MTTTIRARFDGKVFVPYDHVDIPADRDVTIQVVPPPAQRVMRTKKDWQSFFEEMDKHSVEVDHFIDHSRESCYDDTIADPDPL